MANLEESVVLNLRLEDQTDGALKDYTRNVVRSKDSTLRFIRALKEEAKVLQMGADAFRLETAARKGATDAQIKAIQKYQQAIAVKREQINAEKTASEELKRQQAEQERSAALTKRLNDQIEIQRIEFEQGADAAELYKMKLNGASDEQLRQVSVLQQAQREMRAKADAERQAAIAVDAQRKSEERRKASLDRTKNAINDQVRAARLGNDILVRRQLLRDGATRAEYRAIRALQQSTRETRQLSMANSALNQQMRQMRGMAGNFGFQIQDIAVQMQMGTSAAIIFAQQGGQIASIFGPYGAVIGAMIAVGGAIATYFTAEVEGANEALEELMSTADEAVNQFTYLSESAKKYKAAQLAVQMHEDEVALSALNDRYKEAEEALKNHAYALKIESQLKANKGVADQRDIAAQKALVDMYKLSTAELLENNGVIAQHDFLTEQLNIRKERHARLSEAVAKNINLESEERQKLEDALAAEIEAEDKLNQQKAESLAREEEAIEAHMAAVISSNERTKKYLENVESERVADEEKTMAYLDNILAMKAEDEKWRSDRAKQQAEDRAREEQEIMDHLNEVIQINSDFNAWKEESRLAEEAAVEEQLNREIAMREEAAERKRQLVEKELNDQLRLIGGFKGMEQAGTAALNQLILQGGSLKDAFGAVANVISQNVIQTLVQMGVEYIKQKMIMKAIDSGVKATMIAENGMTAGIMAAQWATPAALASLATLGANAAPADAALASTVGFSHTLAAAGSFEGGGYTGFGVRSGGTDGKGGFLATLHPNETVIDHHKGQGMSQPVNISFNISAVDASGVDRLLAERQGMIVSMVNRAMNNAGKRGVV